MKNMQARKKALSSMMKGEAPALKKPGAAPESAPPAADGMVSMMVTPEEQEKILAMRGEGGEAAEQEGAPSPMPSMGMKMGKGKPVMG